MSSPDSPTPSADDPTQRRPSDAPPTGDAVGDSTADDGPTVEDTVAADVDAPAEEPKDAPTEAVPTSDAPIDSTRVLPAEGDKDTGTEAAGGDGTGGGDGEGDGTPAAPTGGETPAVVQKRRNPWPTVGTLAAVLVILAGIGYFGGLGPLNRLSTTRDLDPPDQLSGLNRITDQATRERLQLDQTRDALRRINDGKKASVEAYGEPAGDKLFMIIALRGKVDIDKEIRDSGATGDQVKKIGKSTCATSVQDIPTSCYRGSNTLTVIAQGLNDKADVNSVAAIADEAFDAMK